MRNSSARYRSFCRQAHNRGVDDRVRDHRRGAAGRVLQEKREEKKREHLVWKRFRAPDVRSANMAADGEVKLGERRDNGCAESGRIRVRLSSGRTRGGRMLATRPALPALHCTRFVRDFAIAAHRASRTFPRARIEISTRRGKCIPPRINDRAKRLSNRELGTARSLVSATRKNVNVTGSFMFYKRSDVWSARSITFNPPSRFAR